MELSSDATDVLLGIGREIWHVFAQRDNQMRTQGGEHSLEEPALPTLHLRLPASRTVSQYVSVASAIQSLVFCYGISSKLIQLHAA